MKANLVINKKFHTLIGKTDANPKTPCMKPMILFGLLIFCSYCSMQPEKKDIQIVITEESPFDIMVNLDLPSNDILSKKAFSLYRIDEDGKTLIPCQTDKNHLVWIIDGPVAEGELRYEILVKKTFQEFRDAGYS
jgi:hypothetical protein